ncbi:MAG: GTP cyclohydrolase I FolE [Oscillospiraceae bacterium]|nr:GTP cyclohydrolase I FolE [Oscillospiraceae bacterium]
MDIPRIEAAVREILLAIGENPEREGLRETPSRVAKMYAEIFKGLQDDPSQHLKIFNESSGHDDLIIVRDIPLYSVCEHHLLPFIGKAHIAYIPGNSNIIGLSKLARITDTFARRPQVQERLTAQIADFIYDSLNPQGVAVLIEAEHLCMNMRGARAAGSFTTTSALRGTMRKDAKTRSEVMSLLKGN